MAKLISPSFKSARLALRHRKTNHWRRIVLPTGFTIVELLVVIVVIGILTAVTIVAYNGIQTRAENTITTNAISQYVNGFLAYSALNGTYPIETSWPCLGVYPGTRCGVVNGGACCLGACGTSTMAGFDGLMKDVFSGVMPQLSKQTMMCGASAMSGAFYSPTTGKTATVYYFLRGDQNCSGIGGVQSISKVQQDDATRCGLTMPTLP